MKQSGISRRRCALLLSIAFFAIAVGCSAPKQRLTFPQHPLREDGAAAWYDVDGDGRADVAMTKDAAGRIVSIGCGANDDGSPQRAYRLSEYDEERVPHLIVLLDSIPYRLAADRYAGGHLRMFNPPVKVIAPFPSLTELCYTELLHAPPLPGMIDRFYDRRTASRHDGLWERFTGHEEPWERLQEYHATIFEAGLSYLHPRDWLPAEVDRVRQALDRSPRDVTLCYVISASSMACKYGRAGIEETLDMTEQLCNQLLYERQGAIKITIMADHGHNLAPSTNVKLAEIVKAAKFHVVDRIENDGDVVVEINGLVTYAGLHTRRPATVADAMLARPEVELAMYMVGERVIVRDANGSAFIERRNGKLRYAPVDADVLRLNGAIEGLRRQNKIDADGFAAADDWFRATADEQYPDAPARVWNAFHGMVINPPDVMLTFHDGWCAGDPNLESFIDMASTHGGLNQENTATFVMTMTGKLNGAGPLRTREVMPLLVPGWRPDERLSLDRTR